ncbi:hypothetical protein PABY_14260 [Pyrodictium abyssi]|uniref:Glycoside-hydrolase family GH114 TIM-barrel domain-containing protein n=2 Tax=Pyrodictium abyssi TaxID=54256 RepID=A0ABM8IZU1_9CREN|nr:hypothetical protein PABY_14260 [Pyrodictium abyssi]
MSNYVIPALLALLILLIVLASRAGLPRTPSMTTTATAANTATVYETTSGTRTTPQEKTAARAPGVTETRTIGAIAAVAAATATETTETTNASVWCSITCYYLTGIEPESLLARYWAAAVIEPDEADDTVIAEARKHSGPVLAYLNAGYAEEWRDYWNAIRDEPWVHGATVYEGEYYVEYWRPEWRETLIELAERYLARGFQGVYLDNIDAAKLLAEKHPPGPRG